MKRLVFTFLGLSALVSRSPAQGAIMTVGGALASLCYQSAREGDGRSSAMESCTRALNEESLTTADRAATLVNRGIVYMSAGHVRQADADFDAALNLAGDLPDAWLNKGFLRLRSGDGRDALPMIQKAMDGGVGSEALAVFARGVAHEQMGDYRSAYADLRRAQQLNPRWGLPRDYLASYRVNER